MSYLTMSKAQLLQANEVAKKNNWPRRFEQLELDELRDIMDGNV